MKLQLTMSSFLVFFPTVLQIFFLKRHATIPENKNMTKTITKGIIVKTKSVDIIGDETVGGVEAVGNSSVLTVLSVVVVLGTVVPSGCFSVVFCVVVVLTL